MFVVVPASGRSGLAPLAAPPVLPDPESVSGQRRGLSGAPGRPAPAARPRSPALGRTGREGPFLAAGRGLLQGIRCSCPG